VDISNNVNQGSDKKTVVFIIKYFYPAKRISGIISFLLNLCKYLSEELDLVVITSRTSKNEKTLYHHEGYKIIKINLLFWYHKVIVI